MDNNFSDHFDHRNAVKVLKTHSSGMAIEWFQCKVFEVFF